MIIWKSSRTQELCPTESLEEANVVGDGAWYVLNGLGLILSRKNSQNGVLAAYQQRAILFATVGCRSKGQSRQKYPIAKCFCF